MRSMSESRLSARIRLGYAIAVALWLASLFLPAAIVNGSMRLTGYRVFMIGIDALSAGMPGWLANPLLVAAMAAGLLRRLRLATALSAIAVVLTLSSFYAPTLARARDLPVREVWFEVGFYLWLAACSLILATSAYALWIQKRAGS
jgi:hypothetical protein